MNSARTFGQPNTVIVRRHGWPTRIAGALLIGVLWSSTAGAGGPKTAQAKGKPKDARERASQLFSAGLEAYNKHDYATAIRAFEQSNEAKPHPNTLFALARAHWMYYEKTNKLSHLRRATSLYRKFLQIADPKSPWRETARRHLLEAASTLAGEVAASSSTQPARPPPATQLMITSKTPNARVTIDGAPAGGEPAPAIRTVSAGAHQVRVTAHGFREDARTVMAIDKRLIVTNVDLQPLPAGLRVVSSVDGAAVYVDGQRVGSTPFEQRGLVPGAHAVTVVERGHAPWTSSVDLESGATSVTVANLRWSLQRKIALGLGAGALAVGAAGLISGLIALLVDNSLEGLSLEADRQLYKDRLGRRDRLATASTVLISIAGGALLSALGLYWFDYPDTPKRGAP